MTPGAATVHAGGAVASRLADYATCRGASILDVVVEGAATVLFEQLPAVRERDSTIHGGKVEVGTGKVLIGGPKFSLPERIQILGTAEFQGKVVRDLFLLSTTRTGKEILRRLEASGEVVVIVERGPEKSHECFPTGIQPCGSLIFYSPERASGKRGSGGPGGQIIAGPPQVGLAHELIHAVHFAEGTGTTSIEDPHGPSTEPIMEDEESRTIGCGGHPNEFPSENTLRDDLGLPRRIDHSGGHQPCPKPISLRPGK